MALSLLDGKEWENVTRKAKICRLGEGNIYQVKGIKVYVIYWVLYKKKNI